METRGSSLDEVFNKILNDQALQEQVREAERQQQRELETERNRPFFELGKQCFNIVLKGEGSFTADTKDVWDQLNERYHMLWGHPNTVTRKTIEGKTKHYLEDVIINKLRGMKSGDKTWQEVQPKPADLRAYLSGYGNEALQAGDISSALIAFNEGDWLEDEFEGQNLQKQIAEKVSILTDPKAKVAAAMTWKKIQEAKAPDLTQLPPTP